MSRKHLLIAAGIISALAVAYCACFGPLLFVVIYADQHGWAPNWIDEPLTLLFRPHFWVMYQQEWYFDYINWFMERAWGGSHWNWQEFRASWEAESAPSGP